MKRDCRESGRIILAHGEVTGHVHEVLTAAGMVPTLSQAQFFELQDGTRELIALEPCELVHAEHGRIPLDPANPIQVRQGDVLLHPTGPGTWQQIRQQQKDYTGAWHAVAD